MLSLSESFFCMSSDAQNAKKRAFSAIVILMFFDIAHEGLSECLVILTLRPSATFPPWYHLLLSSLLFFLHFAFVLKQIQWKSKAREEKKERQNYLM